MLRRGLIVGVVLTLGLALMPLSATAAPPDPFRGTWTAVDLDGSDMTLSFAGGRDVRKVRLFDDNATGGVCLARHGRAMARGVGEVSGNTLTGHYDDVRCLDGPTVPFTVPFELVHDAATDTLTDDTGVVWFRPGVVPTDPFLGAWRAIDLDGSAMGLSFAPDGGSRTVTLYDDNATGGICESGEGRALARGTGDVTGSTITGIYDTLTCLETGNELTDLGFAFVHDPATDTLTDDTGVVWFRHLDSDAGPAPFQGDWVSVDVDGSNQTLSVEHRGTRSSIVWTDDDATEACTDGGPAELTGDGAISADGNTLHVAVRSLTCASGEPNPALELPVVVDFRHDDATDTLTDVFGVVWSRS